MDIMQHRLRSLNEVTLLFPNIPGPWAVVVDDGDGVDDGYGGAVSMSVSVCFWLHPFISVA